MDSAEQTEWTTVAQAAAATSSPTRTVYSWAKNGEVPHRDDDGRMLVQLSAVQSRAARRTQQTPAIARAANGVQQAADTDGVLAARERIELARLAADEARAERDRIAAQAELAQASAALQRAQAEGELGFRRAGLEADDVELRLQRERATDSARAREQAARLAQEQERARRAKASEDERRAWVARWLAWAVNGAAQHIGVAAGPIATETVKRVLIDLDPNMPEATVEGLLGAGLLEALGPQIEAKREGDLSNARARLVRDAMDNALVRERTAECQAAAREAAERRAAEIDPFGEDAERSVWFAAALVARRERVADARAEEIAIVRIMLGGGS